MTIAITGSTGQLGRLVLNELKAKTSPEEIIALARTPEKAADLGVTVRQADYDKAETLVSALRGVDKLLLISASEIGRRVPQHKAVIDAAKQVGVKHIIYTSILRADTSPISLADEHQQTEELIQASGIPFTFLRNGWYTENYTAALAGALAHGAIAGSAEDGKIASAARADYAAAAAAVLAGSGHQGKTYELAGDESYTLTQLAAEVSKQSGKEVKYSNMPEAEYAQLLESVGLPPPVAQLLADADAVAAKGALFDDGHQLQQLIGRPTTPLSQAVATALGTAALSA